MKKINVSRLAFSFNTYSLCVYVCMQLGMDSTYIWIYEQSIFLVKIHQCFYTWKNHIQMTIPLLLKTKPKESMKKKRKPKPSPSQKKKEPNPNNKTGNRQRRHTNGEGITAMKVKRWKILWQSHTHRIYIHNVILFTYFILILENCICTWPGPINVTDVALAQCNSKEGDTEEGTARNWQVF